MNVLTVWLVSWSIVFLTVSQWLDILLIFWFFHWKEVSIAMCRACLPGRRAKFGKWTIQSTWEWNFSLWVNRWASCCVCCMYVCVCIWGSLCLIDHVSLFLWDRVSLSGTGTATSGFWALLLISPQYIFHLNCLCSQPRASPSRGSLQQDI